MWDILNPLFATYTIAMYFTSFHNSRLQFYVWLQSIFQGCIGWFFLPTALSLVVSHYKLSPSFINRHLYNIDHQNGSHDMDISNFLTERGLYMCLLHSCRFNSVTWFVTQHMHWFPTAHSPGASCTSTYSMPTVYWCYS